MRRRTRWIAAAAVAVAITGGGTAVVAATDRIDDREAPITGEPLVRVSAAVLEHTGSGRVTGTEVGDEESLYEVEVTLDDGRQLDVQLDADFEVVGAAADLDSPDDDTTGQR